MAECLLCGLGQPFIKQKSAFLHLWVVIGFFEEEEFENILSDIERAKPDVVFVAMGSPKQEFLMNHMKARHPALYMGLGGSFDVYTGNVQRSPRFWIDNNMEWAYRLIKQPTVQDK